MKNARRLIPVFALLLVTAIMLSTASYAWFTMNETVTANGMEIKAKASGNLLISLDKMTAADQAITVNLTSNRTEIVPITYTTAWQIPDDSSKVDPNYGYLDGAVLEPVEFGDNLDYNASNYFVDYRVYIATAGDADTMKNQALYITMDMTSAAADIAPAYSIAFYVDKNNDGLPAEDEYAGYVNYKNFADAKTNSTEYQFDLTGAWDIPSTYGATADSKQGLAIIMRVFADGNLKSGTTNPLVPDYVEYGANDTYGTDKGALKFFEQEDDGTYTPVDTSQWTKDQSLNGYFSWDGTKMVADTSKTVDTFYVNNADIPTGSTTFNVTIGAKAAN